MENISDSKVLGEGIFWKGKPGKTRKYTITDKTIFYSTNEKTNSEVVVLFYGFCKTEFEVHDIEDGNKEYTIKISKHDKFTLLGTFDISYYSKFKAAIRQYGMMAGFAEAYSLGELLREDILFEVLLLYNI